MTNKDGGPAFPSAKNIMDPRTTSRDFNPGMTLRDWFAGQALAGILATDPGLLCGEVAADAYSFADAMLAEGVMPVNRSKGGE